MSSAEDVEKWIGHSRMSDPAHHAAAIADLPSAVDLLADIIGGLLIHADWLSAYGLDETQFATVSRTTLPIADRLDQVAIRDGQAFHIARPPRRRSVGTCRDFALMLCSFLRCKGVPSRLRCGFAAYLGGRWEDHWVCEYWNRETRNWHLGDAQIDGVLADTYRIAVDRTDVPRNSFMTASDAWTACRNGRFQSEHFGHGAISGLWFVKLNVIRDHLVLNHREISAWDTWRAAPASTRVVSDQDRALIDGIASDPAQSLIEIAPDW